MPCKRNSPLVLTKEAGAAFGIVRCLGGRKKVAHRSQETTKGPPLSDPVFAFSDDEHRTRGVSYDPFGGASHEHMLEAGMAMGRDDDQVGFAIVRDVGDYFEGRAQSHYYFFYQLRLDHAFRQCIQFFLQRLDREMLAHGDISEVHWIRKRLDGVKQRDLCFKLLREWHRVFERLLRDF
jgi:hypothetical protein